MSASALQITLVKFQINGDAIITGSLLDNNLNPVVGALANWQNIVPVPSFTIGNSGTVSYTTQNGSFRGAGNEVIFNLEIGGTVTTTPTDAAIRFHHCAPLCVQFFLFQQCYTG